MCGISGFIYKEKDRCAELKRIKVMTDIIEHRGPDDEGHYLDEELALGHRRLSIIDLSQAGHQPMESIDGNYIVVFNGEIYNYIEIRKELEKLGHKFKTKTDTEVLLESYKEWGFECVNYFNGMWAFAIYDKSKKVLFLSRDRFGIKPLYYLNRDDVLAFASEIKSILAGFQEERIPNEEFIHYFLPNGMLDDGPETFFKNIVSLEPAHNIVYDFNSHKLENWRYWDINENKCYEKWIKGKNPVKAFGELINSSLQVHLRSDVPVGVCLSGGVDSSTIAGIAGKKIQKSIHTFSGIYEDEEYNEKKYVDSVNKHINATSHLIYPEPKGNLIDDLYKITWHQDGPSAGPGLYTQYYVMKEAKNHVKVLLDGQGGDELFAGYIPYFNEKIKDLLKFKGLIGRIKALNIILDIKKYWGTEYISTSCIRNILGDVAFGVFGSIFSDKKISKINTQPPSMFTNDFISRLDDGKIKRNYEDKFDSELINTLYWQLTKQSIPVLLHYEDRNSMAFSIESRVPLLDYRIVEFAMGLNAEYKIKGSWTKWILRKQCEKVVPRKVAWRRSKMGYPTPFARWIRIGKDQNDIKDILFSKSLKERNIISEDAIKYNYDLHMSGVDKSWFLYRIVTLELWYRQFIDKFEIS